MHQDATTRRPAGRTDSYRTCWKSGVQHVTNLTLYCLGGMDILILVREDPMNWWRLDLLCFEWWEYITGGMAVIDDCFFYSGSEVMNYRLALIRFV